MAEAERAPQIARQLVAERALGLRGEIERQDPRGRGDEHREQEQHAMPGSEAMAAAGDEHAENDARKDRGCPLVFRVREEGEMEEAEGRVFGEIGEEPREHAQGGENEIGPALRSVEALLDCGGGLGRMLRSGSGMMDCLRLQSS